MGKLSNNTDNLTEYQFYLLSFYVIDKLIVIFMSRKNFSYIKYRVISLCFSVLNLWYAQANRYVKQANHIRF